MKLGPAAPMSAEIINLRRARKDAARKARETEAEANRHRFGRTKTEKRQQTTARDKAARLIEGHRRNADDGNDEGA